MRTKTNPAFYADELRRWLADDPERYEQALADPDNLDLLTWNVFASLDTHTDAEWLAYRMQAFGGAGVRAPVRLSLWTGRDRGPTLQPSSDYASHLRAQQAGRSDDAADAPLAAFLAPIEVPVRIESPDVLVLVDVARDAYPRGAGGRDRLLELVDAGLDHARRLDKDLAVALVYRSGSPAALDISARVNQLRDRATLAAELPYRTNVPAVTFREVPWQQLLRVWEQEIGYLRLGGQPVRAFLDHTARRGLR
jgi:hypothetical protein